MIKLLHISQLGGGGRERRMVQLVRGLDATGDYDQYIITFKKEVGYKEVFDTKAKIFYVTTRDKRQMWKEITSILREVKPDIVHAWEDEPRKIFPALWMKHKLHYKLVEGFVANGMPINKKSKGYIAYWICYRLADKIVSNSMAGLIAKCAPLSKSEVIYNGFDYKRFSNEVNRESLRSELGITTKYVAIMCARFTNAKDFTSFSKVAELAQNNHIDITFLAVGDGERLDEEKNIANSLGLSNIKFLGKRSDVENLVRICDVSFLLTNASAHAEGISNSIMESMAAGVPVIATNGGGTPEIITDNMNGYLVKPGDYETAYKCLIKLLEDEELYAQMSNAAIAQVKTKFLLDNMTVEYCRLYDSIRRIR